MHSEADTGLQRAQRSGSGTGLSVWIFGGSVNVLQRFFVGEEDRKGRSGVVGALAGFDGDVASVAIHDLAADPEA